MEEIVRADALLRAANYDAVTAEFKGRVYRRKQRAKVRHLRKRFRR